LSIVQEVQLEPSLETFFVFYINLVIEITFFDETRRVVCKAFSKWLNIRVHYKKYNKSLVKGHPLCILLIFCAILVFKQRNITVFIIQTKLSLILSD